MVSPPAINTSRCFKVHRAAPDRGDMDRERWRPAFRCARGPRAVWFGHAQKYGSGARLPQVTPPSATSGVRLQIFWVVC